MEYKKIFGWLFVIAGSSFLMFIAIWSLSTLNGYTNVMHEQKMEELQMEREIALINNGNNTIINYECEYKLINQSLYYEREILGIQKYYEGISYN